MVLILGLALDSIEIRDPAQLQTMHSSRGSIT